MPTPIISVAQMRRWEKETWETGQTEEAVIRRAGAAVADVAEALTRNGDTILVVAGKGHNGDDARLAAKQLEYRERELLSVEDPKAALRELEPLLARNPALILDGLFGIGLSRPLAEEWLAWVRRLNASGIPILSVDNPSGLNVSEGVPQPEAIRATWTVTLGAVKAGLVQPSAWPYVGRLLVAPDIGLCEHPLETDQGWVQAEDFAGFPPQRAVDTHKGSFGHLLVIAGSLGYHGASVLAARGAQRAQPGLITVYCQEEVYVPVASQLQSTMVRPWPPDLSLPPRCSAILVGPGLAHEGLSATLRDGVGRLWREAPVPMIVDASAMEWLPKGPVTGDALRVMTPHPGEAGRLLGTDAGQVIQDRLGALRRLSREWGGAYIVLKGHQTLVGCETGQVLVNSSGNPQLAQGGSGDLLAGYLSGLLAQPNLAGQPEQTIAYAVWQHGATADRLATSQACWNVESLATHLGNAPRRNLIAGEGDGR